MEHREAYLFGPTGGVVYHMAALRNRRKLWRPFTAQVRDWLADRFVASELIIFGSSAGWTLPDPFLNNFKRVIAVEPDPLGRWLFARRFSRATSLVSIGRADLLPWTSRRPGDFARFLACFPNAAVLFSNILGQLPLSLPADRRGTEFQTRARAEFSSAIGGREWASYHDLLSAPLHADPLLQRRLDQAAERGPLSADSLAALLDPSRAAPLAVTDHETWWLGRPERLAAWNFAGNVTHLTGFVYQRATERGFHPPDTAIR